MYEFITRSLLLSTAVLLMNSSLALWRSWSTTQGKPLNEIWKCLVKQVYRKSTLRWIEYLHVRAKTARYSSARIISASLLTFDILTLPLLLAVCHFLTDVMSVLFSLKRRTEWLSIELRVLNERKLQSLLFRFILWW